MALFITTTNTKRSARSRVNRFGINSSYNIKMSPGYQKQNSNQQQQQLANNQQLTTTDLKLNNDQPPPPPLIQHHHTRCKQCLRDRLAAKENNNSLLFSTTAVNYRSSHSRKSRKFISKMAQKNLNNTRKSAMDSSGGSSSGNVESGIDENMANNIEINGNDFDPSEISKNFILFILLFVGIFLHL